MAFVGAAYVVVHAVEAGVDFSRGLYYNYARFTQIGNQIAVFELLVCSMFLLWAFLVTVLSLVGAGEIWTQLNARFDGMDPKIGGTPLGWDKSMKAVTLCLLLGLTILISGYSLGEVAEELISYFAQYDDDVSKEADKKNDSS